MSIVSEAGDRVSDRIFNENRLAKYYWQTANIVDDLGLSVYAFRLYAHLVRVSSLHDVDVSVRALATACRMSVGAVSNAKSELEEAGLIHVREVPGNRGRPFHEITILDIAARNVAHCQSSSHELISSPHELNRSPDELISSRGDTPYKNVQKRSKKQQQHARKRAKDADADEPIRQELRLAGVADGTMMEAIVERIKTRPDGLQVVRLVIGTVAAQSERATLAGRPIANPAGIVIRQLLDYPLIGPPISEAGVQQVIERERQATEKVKHAQQHRGKSVRRRQVEYGEGERRASDEQARKQLEALEAERRATAGDRLRQAQEQLSKASTAQGRAYWQEAVNSLMGIGVQP